MNDLFTCLGISTAILGVCIVGSAFMICDKISSLTHEIWELRIDLKGRNKK